MFKKCLLALFGLALALAPVAMAQADNPTVAMLRMGMLRAFDIIEGAMFDVLESYDWISPEENASLHTRQDLSGEKINIVFGSAVFDLPNANLILKTTLDSEPDVIIAITNAMTQLVVNATSDMDDPPVILFTEVYNPYETGVIESACVKPAHVSGSLSASRYDDIIGLLLAQNPDIQTIGTIFDSSDAAGAVGAEEIMRIGEDMGLTVEAAAVTNLEEINLAARGLISKGVEAFVMPVDLRTYAAGLFIIKDLSEEYGIPIFHPILVSIFDGAMVSSGFFHFYSQGDNVGRLLAAHLNGDIEIAATAVNEQSSSAIGVNLDAAAAQGIEISPEIIEQADAVIQNGQMTISDRVGAELRSQGAVIPLEDRLEADQEFLAQLHCSPERIAEEQAALDADE